MGATHYVERNPVKAGLVERAEDWRWSSAAAHVGDCDESPAEGAWLAQRAAGMINTWREHLARPSEAELAAAMRHRASTNRHERRRERERY